MNRTKYNRLKRREKMGERLYRMSVNLKKKLVELECDSIYETLIDLYILDEKSLIDTNIDYLDKYVEKKYNRDKLLNYLNHTMD